MSDDVVRRLEREWDRLGLVVQIVRKDYGYDGHEDFAYVVGPLTSPEQFQAMQDEYSTLQARARDEGLRDADSLAWTRAQARWVDRTGYRGPYPWRDMPEDAPERGECEAERAAAWAPFRSAWGGDFSEFLEKHKGFARLKHQVVMLP